MSFLRRRGVVPTAVLAILLLAGGDLVADAAMVNFRLLGYLRDWNGDSAPADWRAEDLLIQRFTSLAPVNAAAARQPHYRLFSSLRNEAVVGVDAICPGERRAWLLMTIMNRARRMTHAGEMAAAERLYRWLDVACPGSFDVLVDWAALKRRAGNFDESAALFERALAQQPMIVPSDHIDKPAVWWRKLRQAAVYAELGNLYLEMDNPQTALRALELHCDVSPVPPGAAALQLLGMAYARVGRVEDARRTFRAALVLQSDLQDAADYLRQTSQVPR